LVLSFTRWDNINENKFKIIINNLFQV